MVLTTNSGPNDRLILGSAPTASSTPAETGDGSVYYKVVRSLTPSSWTIRDIDSRGWQANVDDGHGAGRLYIGVSPHPGSLQQHPCRDPEFKNGATCVETMLDADTRLIVRGLSHDNPVRSVMVVIVHADGGGVDVGADNATWPDPPPSGTRVTREQKLLLSKGTVNRPEPVYSTDQLVEIAKAIDAATG